MWSVTRARWRCNKTFFLLCQCQCHTIKLFVVVINSAVFWNSAFFVQLGFKWLTDKKSSSILIYFQTREDLIDIKNGKHKCKPVLEAQWKVVELFTAKWNNVSEFILNCFAILWWKNHQGYTLHFFIEATKKKKVLYDWHQIFLACQAVSRDHQGQIMTAKAELEVLVLSKIFKTLLYSAFSFRF